MFYNKHINIKKIIIGQILSIVQVRNLPLLMIATGIKPMQWTDKAISLNSNKIYGEGDVRMSLCVTSKTSHSSFILSFPEIAV